MTSAKSVVKAGAVGSSPAITITFGPTSSGTHVVWHEPDWHIANTHRVTVLVEEGVEAGKAKLEAYIQQTHKCSLATLRSLGVVFEYMMSSEGTFCTIDYCIDPTTQALLDHGNDNEILNF